MEDIIDKIYYAAMEAREEGHFEWARIMYQAAEEIRTLRKDLEDNRRINELFANKPL